MTGKAVDFSTVKGETANVTFYNVFPGEETLKLTDIPISGDANGYSFSGNGTGNLTGSTFNYSGRVENGQLTVNLTKYKDGEQRNKWPTLMHLATSYTAEERI